MGSTDFTKLLFLLSIAQWLEWRGQTQFCWSSTIWLVANRFGPTTVRTKRANSERRLDQPENFWGPLFMGPCWLSFQCPECSLYSIPPLAFTSGGHYWTDRDGFGGHGIYGFHQTFIPAFNSTTARVERPGSILLIVHHLTCCQPLRSYYCENQRFVFICICKKILKWPL